ncbi:hypothetical protein BDV28DRAFT_149351 [Aspergillus coremiiformis]|uniref:Uncharacterized protein n=1 Tax=Aspergillus coremiiformis TaxID=138285 RepID=A0A5N6Z355_9EURO|nr:hypothetical protein BDV28DRAFT_149351 [Aspergillus coremiiformis]
MECVHGRISYASWRLRVFRRLFLSSSELNGSRTVSRRTIASSTGQKESQSQQLGPQEQSNRHKNGESMTDNEKPPLRLSETLPQSPFMTSVHPNLARKRKKRTATNEDLDDLRRNPWAMALASPPRMCSATGIRVPRALLTDWAMVERTESEGLWFLPVGLLKNELASPATGNKSQSDPDSLSEPPSPENQNRPPRMLRIVDRLPILIRMTKSLASSKLGAKSPLVRLLPYRWKHPLGPFTSRDEKRIIWREDMPEFVLSKIRADAVRQLKHACRMHRRSDATHGVWTTFNLNEYSEAAIVEGLKGLESLGRMECGAVLVTGILDGGHSAMTETDLRGEVTSHALNTLPEYVTLPQVQSKVPVFNLAWLFSEEELVEICGYDSRFQSPALFFRPTDKITVNAMLALWKLKGFVRHDSAYEDEDPDESLNEGPDDGPDEGLNEGLNEDPDEGPDEGHDDSNRSQL